MHSLTLLLRKRIKPLEAWPQRRQWNMKQSHLQTSLKVLSDISGVKNQLRTRLSSQRLEPRLALAHCCTKLILQRLWPRSQFPSRSSYGLLRNRRPKSQLCGMVTISNSSVSNQTSHL